MPSIIFHTITPQNKENSMKKIFLIGLMSLFLVGCNKTVTNEMLIGNWECNFIDYKSTWDKNKLGKLKKIGEGTRVLLSFKYEDNTLYAKNPNTGEWEKGNLVKEYNSKTSQQEDDLAIYKTTSSIKKISNDKFIMTYEFETITKLEKHNIYNRKLKNEAICTRIK